MSIVANNSYMFNMEMDFWEFRGFDANDLLGRWNELYDFAKDEHTEDAAFFLADCMDVLYEKVMQLQEEDRALVLDKARNDVAGMTIGESVLRMAG